MKHYPKPAIAYSGNREQKFGFNTYSQNGDDLMIINLFTLMGVARPSYLDIGAHHPLDISNTALLYARGSRGVNVEANPSLIYDFNRLRPDDITLNVGVGVKNGAMPFYMWGENHGRNTFSEEEVKSLSNHKVQKTIQLPVVTISELVKTYCNGRYPDFLSLDIEGLDFNVIESTDFSLTRPKLIVVETRPHQGAQMKALLKSKDYFCYCRMGENLFFVHKEYEAMVY